MQISIIVENVYIVYLIYNFVAIDKNKDYVDILLFITRIIYSLFSFRFLIIFNFVNLIINFSKIKEKHKLMCFTYLAAITIANNLYTLYLQFRSN